MARVAHHADDGHPGQTVVFACGPDLFPQWILAGKELARQLLVDQRHRRLRFHVARSKAASAFQRHAQSGEVLRVSGSKFGIEPLAGIRGATEDFETPSRGTAHRNAQSCGRREHAGQRAHALQNVSDETHVLLWVGIVRRRQREVRRQNVVGAKAEVHGADGLKAAHQESGAHQQYERKRNLSDDLRVP